MDLLDLLGNDCDGGRYCKRVVCQILVSERSAVAPGFIILVVLLFANLITVALFGETEFWFALIKIVAIVALILVGIVLVAIGFKTPQGHASLTNLVDYGGLFPKGIKGFIMSFQMVTFGFIGIEMIGVTASETENPKKSYPRQSMRFRSESSFSMLDLCLL